MERGVVLVVSSPTGTTISIANFLQRWTGGGEGLANVRSAYSDRDGQKLLSIHRGDIRLAFIDGDNAPNTLAQTPQDVLAIVILGDDEARELPNDTHNRWFLLKSQLSVSRLRETITRALSAPRQPAPSPQA